MSTAIPEKHPQLSDFVPFTKFATEYAKQGLGSPESLRWMVRFRKENGMLESGAVIELRNPGSRRPRLIINRHKFPEWLASGGQGVAL